jgi:hypothetical protein
LNAESFFYAKAKVKRQKSKGKRQKAKVKRQKAKGKRQSKSCRLNGTSFMLEFSRNIQSYTVIASEAKQSGRRTPSYTGLLRYARNDVPGAQQHCFPRNDVPGLQRDCFGTLAMTGMVHNEIASPTEAGSQ